LLQPLGGQKSKRRQRGAGGEEEKEGKKTCIGSHKGTKEEKMKKHICP